ncbi:hypothetical protein EV179_000355 [Coemansia sp. RSA 487]|nr:hypothetical protein LPJ74_002317 [Coemansia sp. RSA 1843]KAJ2217521.1 hypothetical protein EV179_000355 [Coemansia sp. RSA 487]
MKISAFHVAASFAAIGSALAQDNGYSASIEPAMMTTPAMADMNQQTEQAMAPGTGQAMAPETGQAMAANTEQPMAANTEQPMAANTEQPMAANTEQPMAANTEQPMAANTEQAVSAGTEQAMSTGTEQSMPLETEQPGMLNVGGTPMYIGGGMPSMIQPLINRIVSFFDLSHISITPTDTPVMLHHVYDPATGKFTHLTMDVMQSGNGYYVPVCAVSSFTNDITSASQDCPYAIQLNPVPINVAQSFLRLVHTGFNIFRSLALPKLWFGESYSMRASH